MSSSALSSFSSNVAEPRYVPASLDKSAPFRWIRLGIADFRKIPGLSVLYGALFVALCIGIDLLTRSYPWFSVGYLTGFVVVGPFLAAGLYTASRDLERGVAPSIAGSMRLLGQRKTYLGLFSLILALIMAAWVRFSALLFAITFDVMSPSIETFTSLFGSTDGFIALAFFVGIGFLLVLAVFVASAVAIPLILDRDANFITAIQTSYQTVRRNPSTMAIWAGSIVALTAIGVLSGFIGFVVIFPVLGYATWHSYREAVS